MKNRQQMNNSDIIIARELSKSNKTELLDDTKCGCFYCLKIFHPKEIKRWLREGGGTAVCPYCGIDSVIGESSGYPITKDFLREMKEYWF